MPVLYREYDEQTLKKLQQTELNILSEFCDFCEENDIDYFGVGGTGIGALRHGGFIPWDDDIDIGFLRKDYDKFLKLAEEKLTDKYYVLNTEMDHRYPLMTTRLVLKGTEFREECFKDLQCNMGIFLDLYCFDNIPDNELLMKWQGFRAWFLGKMMILCSIGEPVLYFDGLKKNVILFGTKLVNKVFSLFRITPYTFYKRVKKIITKYEDRQTARVAYCFDPKLYTSIMKKDDILPTKIIKYDGLNVRFPAKLEAYLSTRYGDYMTMPAEENRHNHPPYKLKFKDENA